jgi:D-threo-aldose 1-dehydrogenase
VQRRFLRKVNILRSLKKVKRPICGCWTTPARRAIAALADLREYLAGLGITTACDAKDDEFLYGARVSSEFQVGSHKRRNACTRCRKGRATSEDVGDIQVKGVTVRPFRGILRPDMIPLGFGCGGLLAGRSRRQSLRLLETALDCGVTYFDTARMYGVGCAEGILGELMPRYRNRIILTSKAGILPTHRPVSRRVIDRASRLLRTAMPKLKDYLPESPLAEPRFGVFGLPDLRKSVETSLRELRTDHLDILLLHECRAEHVADPDVLEFLKVLQKQGTIREFGIATGIEESIEIIQTCELLAPVVQIPNSIWDMNIGRIPVRSDSLTITHSCMAGRFHGLRNQLCADGTLAWKWRILTGVDPHDALALAQLFLAHALRANPGGIVLFSSSKPENIQANVKSVKESIIDPAQLDGLAAAVLASGLHQTT